MVKYPDIEVSLVGEDGNAFTILGKVQLEMRRCGVDRKEVKEFFDEATSGDYDHLLQTAMNWVTVS